MAAPQVIISGERATFSVAIAPVAGRRTVPTLRLRLKRPGGGEQSVRAEGMTFSEGFARVGVVLREPGAWEYQFETAEQVYEHGTVFVKRTGFTP